ncbi:hypothetical protein HELRODRAFT_182833 [Helobdella robusta]|uniref:Uncharacterized protein n=1 Tax=Helobdella robusta TaxID=6412 RepID=T1FIU0_HELRO|nr:hypothetical protein HELRODRAFT_182833 [Helobdella robusta]ESN90136.1 hypothetical protein HELRODRAFT_182833 [Helobdella robusta]
MTGAFEYVMKLGEISAALKQIKHDVNLLKIDVNFDTPRGPKKKDKKDKLRETIRYLGLVREKKLSTELPTYVSSNLRVPNNDSILKFNFNEMKNDICNMLHNQQLYLCSMLNAAPRVHKSELNTNNTDVNNVKSYSVAAGQKHASYSSDASSPKIVHPASSVINTPPSDETSKQGTQSLWPRRLLEHCYFKKKRKYTPITVGSKEPESFKLSAAPLPPKKIVFGVGKLKSCVKEEILEHLETIGLTAAECVPVFKFSPTRPQPSTSDPSTKFRITIFKHQEMIFTNPENWPIGVEIHPWLFHARPQHLIKPTTTSLPNHYPVDLPNVNTPLLVNSHQHVENTVEVASILTSLSRASHNGPFSADDQHFNAYNTHIDPTKNLLDSFTRQSSYYTTRDLLNILEAKYINNHDHPLPLLHINSRKTWLNDETAKLVRMNDYNFVFKNRSDRIGGGVGIFIRSGIEFSMINNLLLNGTIIDLLGVNLKLKIKQHTRKYFSSI